MNKSILDRRRQIRTRSTLIASADYALNIAILGAFFFFAKVELPAVIAIVSLTVLINVVFLSLIISGKSESYSDPSLTTLQISAGCIANLVSLALAPQMAYVFAINLFIPLAYGSLHFKRESFVVAWLLVSISFGTIIHFSENSVQFAINSATDRYLFALVVSSALGRFLIINAEVANIRCQLRDKNRALKKAFGLLREVTEKDELTGMANRQAFTNILQESCNPLVEKNSLYIAIIEIGALTKTDIKTMREKSIRAVSDILSCRLRRSDTIARFSENQFALLLPESPKHAVIRVLERARLEIEDINWAYYNVKPPVTTSIGLAEWLQGDNPFETLAQCESALSTAKLGKSKGFYFYGSETAVA